MNKWRKAHNVAKSDLLDAQTISNIIATDANVQYVSNDVFETNSAAFLAILSRYPTSKDIINAPRCEVFNHVYEATKHRVKINKIDILYARKYQMSIAWSS